MARRDMFGDRNPSKRKEVRLKISQKRKGQHNSPKTQFNSQSVKLMHSNPEMHNRMIKPLLEHNKKRKIYSSLAEKRLADVRRDRNKRMECLIHYGGNPPRCARCGYSADHRGLCIDHIRGGGNKDRQIKGRRGRLERWLVKNNFPEGYQILCGTCNMIKKVENSEFGIKKKNKELSMR